MFKDGRQCIGKVGRGMVMEVIKLMAFMSLDKVTHESA